MTLEDTANRFSGDNDRFPVGLRVLAVDDDASCLKLVENLLRKCQYNVTTTNQPMEALKMLRGNKDQFDIVITDVNMPGMDGYKLLELIGLEMDLPVIMLSAHSDTEFVMKGIYHGACDYLVKPCRMAEIKNIWQHVVRKKSMDQKGKNDNSNPDEQGFVLAENSDNLKVGRKRKEQIEGGEDERDENENEDPSTQKKPRVVWSVELHRKFVAAVTQLTLKKAVPKKILDLMNVEGLTRENVASHLQKYRLYLKRISTAGIQQENPMHISLIEGFGLSGSRIFSSNVLSSYPQVEVLGKVHSPSGLNLRGIVSPRLIQHSTSRNLNDSLDSPGKFPQSQSPDLFNEIPTLLDLTDLHPEKSLYREFNPISTATGFSYAPNFPDNKVALNSSIDSISRFPANRMILDGKNHGAITPLKSESFEIDGNVALNLLGHDQSNGNWQQGVHLSKFPPTGLGSSDACYHCEIPSNSSKISYGHSPIGFPLTNSIPKPLLDSRGDEQCREDLIGIVAPTMDFTQKQEWEEHNLFVDHNPSGSAINSRVLADEVMNPLSRRMDQNGLVKVEKLDVSSLIGHSNDNFTSFGQHNLLENLVGETKMNFNANNILNMAQHGFIPSDFDSLDNMVNVVSEQEANEPTTIIDGGFWM